MLLEADLTGFGGDELRQTLLGLLGEGKSLELDASQVQRIDMAGVQLLLAFAREARAKNMQLRWSPCSQVFAEALVLCGLNDELETGLP